MDQKNHHQIPLNPPLPVCDRKKITKGGKPYPLPLAAGPRGPLARRAKGGCLPARSRFGEGRGEILQGNFKQLN
jgi:hypothetical protein